MFLPELIQSSVGRDERANILNMSKAFFLFVSCFFIFIIFGKQIRNRKTFYFNQHKIIFYGQTQKGKGRRYAVL